MEEDGNSFGIEELVTFLGVTGVLDHWLTAEKVRDYLQGVCEGVVTKQYGGDLGTKFNPKGITWPHFQAFMYFAADMRGLSFQDIEAQVLRHFVANSDVSCSLKWRLSLVFEAFGKAVKGRMSPLEFASLCKVSGLIASAGALQGFKIGDSLAMCKRFGAHGPDFDGFCELLDEVAEKTSLEKDVRQLVADTINTLDNDEFVVVRMRLNLKEAATNGSIVSWEALFREIDPDGSGQISWDEFRDMCRNKLSVQAKDWDLRRLFVKLDQDKSGELDQKELIDFIEHGVVAKDDAQPTLTSGRANTYAGLGFAQDHAMQDFGHGRAQLAARLVAGMLG